MNSCVLHTNMKRVLLSVSTLQVTAKHHFAQVRKKFYKNVTVAGTPDCYEINLDHRKLKTPEGNIFQVPNYPLALAVASEWMSVEEKITPAWMYLTTLSNTVVDNPQKLSKEDIAKNALEYLTTDTLLFKDNSEEDFVSLQSSQWDPILDWFNHKFESNIEPSEGLSPPDVTKKTMEALTRYLLSYNMWSLSGILYGTEALKSLILTVAAIERKIEPDQAVRLSLLETEFQTGRWGNVEWAHDLDKLELLSRFSAAVLFAHLNSSHHVQMQKIGNR